MSFWDKFTGSIGSAFNGVVDAGTKVLNSDALEALIKANADEAAAESVGSGKKPKTVPQQTGAVPAWALWLGGGSLLVLIAALLMRRD